MEARRTPVGYLVTTQLSIIKLVVFILEEKREKREREREEKIEIKLLLYIMR